MYRNFVNRISILVVACLFIASLMGEDASASLKDVPSNYSEEINYLLNKNVINGYPDQTFGPKLNVTREEAVKMVGSALGLDGKQRATSFKDVAQSRWSSGYIQTAYENKILMMSAEGTFRPTDKMTRGEMSYLIQRAFNLTKKEAVAISDVQSSGALYEAISAVVTSGLSNGYPDGTFKPNNAMTREEFALFVARALNPDFRVTYEATPIATAVVNATSLNVRSGPSTDYTSIGSIQNGASVTLYKYEGLWAFVSSGNIKGYVHTDYLVDITSTSAEKIVTLDPGHGGKDPGAIGNGLQEKEVNLAVALKVENILKQNGIKVIMTRRNDTFLELSERVDVALNNKADTFVSIHANKFSSESANGTETYFSTAALNSRSENSKQLATFIQNRLYKALGTTNRGVKEANYHVIAKNPLPATLIELGFISNQSDASKLASEAYRNKAAEAIALGIVDYYNWKK